MVDQDNRVVVSNTKRIEILENYRTSGVKHSKEDRMSLIEKLGLDTNPSVTKVLDEYPEFLTSPASTKFHGAYEGGLFDHSMAVYENLLKLAPVFDIDLICIPAVIFHDLCKVGKYKFDQKTGKYQYDYSVVQLHHGPESLRRLFMCGIYVPEQWQFAISYHMGAFDGDNDYGNACEKYKEVLLLHTADMMASKINKI